MATPQQRPDPEQPRELEDMQHRDLQREIGPRWRFGFWWIWIIVFVAIWWVAFGWGNSGGYIWGHHGAARPVNDTMTAGPGLPILDASTADKHNYVDQAFIIRNVQVEQVANPHAMWIGNANNSVPMLLMMPGNASTRSFAHGEWANVSGQIRKAPPAAQAQKQWSLSPTNTRLLETQGVYIQGTQVARALRRSTTAP